MMPLVGTNIHAMIDVLLAFFIVWWPVIVIRSRHPLDPYTYVMPNYGLKISRFESVLSRFGSSACPREHKCVDPPERYMAPITCTLVQLRLIDPYGVDMLSILYDGEFLRKQFAVKISHALSSSLMAPCN